MRTSLQLVLVILVALLVVPHALVDGQCSSTRVRRSLNQLNQAEWDALNRGIRAMKANGSLDRLTRLHRQGMQWHGTPHFFLMHRALMTDFENELLRVSPTLTGVPYWDELREGAGILRSDVFTNNRLSPIRAGPLQGVLSGLRDDSGQLVQRNPQNLSPGYTWLPPNEVMTRALERMANYGDFSRIVEVSPHNQFHVYVGGHMGNPSISPSDPAFWMHHAYIDLLWALWQSLRPQNRENLQAWGSTRPGIDPASPVVLYNGRYTNLDMLRYRTRLCYQYAMPSTRASRLARRSFEMTRSNPTSPAPPISPGEAASINLPAQPEQPPIRPPTATQHVTETVVVTEVDKETQVVTETQVATAVVTEVVTEYIAKEIEQPTTSTREYEGAEKPDATEVTEPQYQKIPTPYFKPMWEAPADLVYQIMPNMSLAEWRKVEDDLNTAIAELNAEIATGRMLASQLKTVEDLFFNSGMNCTKEVDNDDYRDSLIPEVQQLATSVVKQTDDSSSASRHPMMAGFAVMSVMLVVAVALGM